MQAIRSSAKSIAKYILFEILGIILFVLFAKGLLVILLWFFHNIHKETVFGFREAAKVTVITAGEFILAIGIMIGYCFVFQAIFDRVGNKPSADSHELYGDNTDIAYLDVSNDEEMDDE